MSYGWTCFSVVFVFQDDMSYEMKNVLREVMFCRRKVLWEVVCWWSVCLQDDIFYITLYFTERHF